MSKFQEGEAVTILGTDNQYATVAFDQPTNANLVLVYLFEPGAVYPYVGATRLYPEELLEKVVVH